MATVTISVSLDPEIAKEMRQRIESLHMGQSEYLAHLIRNDLIAGGTHFQIVVETPKSKAKRGKT